MMQIITHTQPTVFVFRGAITGIARRLGAGIAAGAAC